MNTEKVILGTLKIKEYKTKNATHYNQDGYILYHQKDTEIDYYHVLICWPSYEVITVYEYEVTDVSVPANTKDIEEIVDDILDSLHVAKNETTRSLVRPYITTLTTKHQEELEKAVEAERERIALMVDSLSLSTGAPERAMEYKAAWQFGNDVIENVKRKLLKAINK